MPSRAEYLQPVSDEPRQLTEEEIRAEFLGKVADMSVYWARQGGTPQEVADRVAYGMLRLLCGDSGDIPRFALVADPHPEDKAYRQSEGDDWYPEMGELPEGAVDITSNLYYEFQQLLGRLGRLSAFTG